MLSRDHRLYFPRLERIGDFKMVRRVDGGQKNTTEDGYRLDWSKQEATIRKKYEDWRFEYHPEKDIPYVPQLPVEYDEWVKNLLFAIPISYLREIKRMTRLGLEEWDHYRPFDTMIRELCLEPATTMIRCAFILIGDCVYDPQAEYYSRSSKKQLASYIMAYKFWSHQTGRGVIRYNADLDNLERRLERYINTEGAPISEGEGKTVFELEGRKFLAAIKEHEARMDQAYDMLAIGPPVSCEQKTEMPTVAQ